MTWVKIIVGLGMALTMLPANAFAQSQAAIREGVGATPAAVVQGATLSPYRTWITIDNFEMISNGDPANPISNVKIEVVFPSGKKFELPEGSQSWTIGNGQKQDIKKTYELPWEAIANDGFNFTVQIVRKGRTILPCNFNVTYLSQYNRGYFCHTDLQWQMERKYPDNKIDKEGIQIRVWTDRNTPVKEQPKDALALR